MELKDKYKKHWGFDMKKGVDINYHFFHSVPFKEIDKISRMSSVGITKGKITENLKDGEEIYMKLCAELINFGVYLHRNNLIKLGLKRPKDKGSQDSLRKNMFG